MKELVEHVLSHALTRLKTEGRIPMDLEAAIKVERTKDSSHGDFASNLALIIAKPCAMPPRQLAEWLIAAMESHPSIERVELAGPGFINFYLRGDALSQVLKTVLDQGEQYGRSDFGRGQNVLVEFVSANPTGPLHVGHGRGAAFGATLANVLSAAGFNVSREYYVNDAGRQMTILAASVWMRYLNLAGVADAVFPTNAYRGDYILDIARAVLEQHGEAFVRPWSVISENLPADEPQGGDKDVYIDALAERMQELLGKDGFYVIHSAALNAVLDDIKDDLHGFGVHFDDWFSERSLLDSGAIDEGIKALKAANCTYMKGGALWFHATQFGDEKDRVLIRANGQATYFASDVAYHWNKYNRRFDRVIDVFGADHHGYVTRIKASVKALGHDDDALDVLLVQFAILYRQGERVQMSTRSGSFVTLRELREDVGNDAARFFYVMRKPEQHMDFDLDLAKSQSSDNPVYYVQYAHARICSVLRQLQERQLTLDYQLGLEHVALLREPQETALMTLLARYPESVTAAARDCEPHVLAYYLRELANGLHSYYNAVPLLCDDAALRSARLTLLSAVRQVLHNGLCLLGVSAPESM